jgi:DNA gyrase/topoisomerase IV subunit A
LDEEEVVDDGKYHVSIDEIMDIIKGPDFPTGGVIYDPANIREVYKRGK